MTTNFKTPVLLSTLSIGIVAAFLYQQGFLSSDSTPDVMQEMAEHKEPGTTITAPQKSDAQPSQNKKSVNQMPFVVAPDYNDILAAAQMIANAPNKQAEKQWIKLRLGTRVAREQREKEKAEYEKAEFAHKRAVLELKTEGISDGTFSLNGTDQLLASNNAMAPAQAFAGIEGTLLPEQTAAQASPDIDIVGFTNSTSKRRAVVDLLIDSRIYPNMSAGNQINGFSITSVSESSKCVTVIYLNQQSSTLCME